MIELDGTEIKPTIFPDGTSQVWKLDPTTLERRKFNIYWIYEKEEELIHVCQLAQLLDSLGKEYHLELDYLPYGRQDKPVSNEQTFALHTFAHILNSFDFASVTFLDAHSSEATRLIGNSQNIEPFLDINFARREIPECLIAYPDKGARERYSDLVERFPTVESVVGDKVRDQSTGYITHYKISGADPTNRNVLIVDDICDGGMTFKILSKNLHEAGAKSVHLYVTHGIFSKGLETLRESGIDRIFTHEGEIK